MLSAWPISSTWQGRHYQGSTQDCSRTDAALQGSSMPPPRRRAIGAPHRSQSRSEPRRTRRRMRKSKLLGQALEGSLSSPTAQDGDRAARRRSRTGAVARGRGGTSRTERRACGSDTCSRRCRCRASRLRFRTGSGTHPRVEGEENRRMWRLCMWGSSGSCDDVGASRMPFSVQRHDRGLSRIVSQPQTCRWKVSRVPRRPGGGGNSAVSSRSASE